MKVIKMNKKYRCSNCEKEIIAIDDNIPKCCGKEMKKVEQNICIQPAHAEHARPMDEEDACDDGRAG
jgi:hypothetical protein